MKRILFVEHDEMSRDVISTRLLSCGFDVVAEDGPKALETDCGGFDSKPVNLPHLPGKIEALLGKTAAS